MRWTLQMLFIILHVSEPQAARDQAAGIGYEIAKTKH